MRAYQIGMYEKAVPAELSWEERLTCAKDAGYDFVEISIDETEEKLARLHWSVREKQDFLALQLRTGMPVRSLCLSGHRKYPFGDPDPEKRERGLTIMEEACAFASDLGIRIIQLAGYDTYYDESTEETARHFLENLGKAVTIAARYGILLGFETMETPFMNTVAKAMDYVRRIDSPYLNVYPDLGNITNAAKAYGTDVQEDLETGRGRIIALHLKETKPGVFRDLRYGDGHVDFDAAIRKVLSMGVRRFVTEFWYLGEEDWKEELSRASSMMRAKIEAGKGIQP